MKIVDKFIIILVFILILYAGGCAQKKKVISVNRYKQFTAQQIEYRDSLFILYTVKEWGKLNWWTWQDYSQMHKITNEQVEYFIGGIFYSSDKKKVIVWVGEKVPNAETIKVYSAENMEVNKLCPNGSDTVYSMSALIGYREDINQVWKLYPFDQQQATCYDRKEKVINELGQYYFEKMKEHSVYVSKKYLDGNYGGEVRYDLEKKIIKLGYGDKNNSLILKNFGYNLQDKGFWEKSLIWQKGATVKGYYDFQLRGVEAFEPPFIIYPENILKLYSRE